MVKFTIILPIHNESNFLPYSLPSVYRLKPSSVILLFDRCSDNSQKVSKEIAKHYKMLNKTLFINVKKESNFRMRFAFLRLMGCSLSLYDTVLISGADLILDNKIQHFINLIGEYGLITFEYKDYPVNWRMIVKRLLSIILPFNWLGGIRLFDRRLMFKFEDLEELKSLESEDTHLADAIRKHAKTLYIHSNSIHLRPKENYIRHYKRGKLYAQLNRSFLLTLTSAVSLWRFGLLKGYIHERLKLRLK